MAGGDQDGGQIANEGVLGVCSLYLHASGLQKTPGKGNRNLRPNPEPPGKTKN
jgi:hypothetical protein